MVLRGGRYEKQMNYEKIYKNLISSRRNRKLIEGEYYEKHHITPKSIGGDDSPDNLISLTSREHYIAHWLLTKIYKNTWKILFAFFQMAKMNGKNKREITSVQYERAKKLVSLAAKLRMSDMQNPGKSEKSRNKAKNRMLFNNPITNDPSKNHTSRKVSVFYLDGTSREFDMIKDFFCSISPKLSKYKFNMMLKDPSLLMERGIKSVCVEQKINPNCERVWYTDGSTNLYLKTTEPIPDGYTRGMAFQERKKH